jgi:hypothetical protein
LSTAIAQDVAAALVEEAEGLAVGEPTADPAELGQRAIVALA